MNVQVRPSAATYIQFILSDPQMWTLLQSTPFLLTLVCIKPGIDPNIWISFKKRRKYCEFLKQNYLVNPLNAESNPICHFLALLGAHHILHFSRIGVNWFYCPRIYKQWGKEQDRTLRRFYSNCGASEHGVRGGEGIYKTVYSVT
jgi:hypothetical protein